jgi:multiple sugar transport system permease protein
MIGRGRIISALASLSLWLVCIAFFMPVFWIFLAAFKTRTQILTIPPIWVFRPSLEGLRFMVERQAGAFWQYLLNSVIISASAVAIAVFVAYLAAFSLSRFKPAATDFLMFLLLSVRMVPGAAVVLPLFMMYRSLGWIGSRWAIVLFYAMFSLPFSLWILRGFLDGVSRRFDEAAIVDGGSWFHIMFRVVLPQVKPGIAAALIFNMIFVWNEFLFDFILGGERVATIPVALAAGLYTSQGTDWQYIASLTLVYTAPLMVAIFFVQRYLLLGMTFGTVRGEV